MIPNLGDAAGGLGLPLPWIPIAASGSRLQQLIAAMVVGGMVTDPC